MVLSVNEGPEYKPAYAGLDFALLPSPRPLQ